MPSQSELEVTQLLDDWSHGDPHALDRLIPMVIGDLRRIAAGHFAHEPAGHTLQPTALVNELFLRLWGRRQVHWESRTHFFASAAQLVRRILVDHARGRKRDKRGGGARRTSLSEALAVAQFSEDDLIPLDDALKDLARFDPEASRVVELKFFGGLTYEQIGQVLGLAPTTVRRRWKTAKVWLYHELNEE